MPDGTRKIVDISEMTGLEGDTFIMQTICVYKQTGSDANGRVVGYHTATGIIPRFIEDLRERGMQVDLSMFTPKEKLEAREARKV
jgi:pilus assembly protein CpaF